MADKTPCLLCGHAARVRPAEVLDAWLAVDGCACHDFLVGAELWQRRLPHLSAAERQTLSNGLQEQLRHPWGHVWLTTEDGTLNGRS